MKFILKQESVFWDEQIQARHASRNSTIDQGSQVYQDEEEDLVYFA